MTEDNPSSQPISSSAPVAGPAFHIGEEFGTAKKSLPPVKIVLIGVALIAVVALIASLTQRPHSATAGSIDDGGNSRSEFDHGGDQRLVPE
jgi:hypothetical protein